MIMKIGRFKPETPKEWIIDKWEWLKTFNKRPTVYINGSIISVKSGKYGTFIVSPDRCNVVVNSDNLDITD